MWDDTTFKSLSRIHLTSPKSEGKGIVKEGDLKQAIA
jgi:hypothetical protein